MSRSQVHAKNFKTFADLSDVYVEGLDFLIAVVPRFQSGVGVVAPHGGRIEAHTSEIATAIAGKDFSLYLLEGILPSRNFDALHLTSHYFDEPNCLDLLANCDDVVTVHGCNVAGEVVLVGGLDQELANELTESMTNAGIDCLVDGHKFPATHPNNICNRGRRGIGVQLELSHGLRISQLRKQKLIVAVRDVLLRRRINRHLLEGSGRLSGAD